MRLRAIAVLGLLFASIGLIATATPVAAATSQCFGHAATVQPTAGHVYTLTPGDDVVVGGSAADTVTDGGGLTSGGTDYICTGSGNDNVSVYADDDGTIIDTGAGNDYVDVGNGFARSTISTGSGNDTIVTGPGSEELSIDSGSGNDVINDDGNISTIYAGAGQDSVNVTNAHSVDCGTNKDSFAGFSDVVKRCEFVNVP